MTDYERIAKAIEFMTEQVGNQPSLKQIADELHLSEYHFQRMFCRWTGVTPKRFLQVLTVERAKQLLSKSAPLLDVSHSLGLSSGSRLYDHFIHLEAVTPGEYKTKGKGLRIQYAIHDTPFGSAFIATTPKGICNFAFMENANDPSELEALLFSLQNKWSEAEFSENGDATLPVINRLFGNPIDPSRTDPISLHVSGTNFQINVWKALLQIAPPQLSTYSQIASTIGNPKSARAVGQAVGANPVAFLIPCHRVIQQSGQLGGYHWGITRKQAILAWEAARHEQN